MPEEEVAWCEQVVNENDGTKYLKVSYPFEDQKKAAYPYNDYQEARLVLWRYDAKGDLKW